ncbi:serine/threonine-protein kinase [Lignipirellula cremea]|uniref:Serine/threonine-protein kinase PknD n=1 Tax=Lignipirellula cremea TaxID=2528010 RepID=A0A518E3N1_9BACT|nr:serine/threonine-protein kinase [Lignipirellula cremea]QDU98706.1 Serine/threonine-protein kinase PknD [Lignipirellula cremea]
MPIVSADRNLLFGVFALQLDFIDRDQLVHGMNAWVLDKSRSLGDLLVEKGQLHPEDCRALETLIDAHLRRHGGRTEDSLAALQDSSGEVAGLSQELLAIDDDELRSCAQAMAVLESSSPLAEQHTLSEQDLPPDALQVGVSTSTGERFLVLRPHAKGGLGQVLIARDRELAREVALKEIQDKFADDEGSRQQFLLEAEITGSLEHPGVVPVYGLGRYPNGRPYYAMRFIQGESLRSAADRFHSAEGWSARPGERRVELRKLLNHFIDVCNVIEYAFSRNVLHRDLKPDNIMLGKYGETLVVDWGLAARIGPTAPIRTSTRPVGTPAYMSPEQADMERDSLTIASDIYCLGATLYYLLTGSAPLTDRTWGEVLEKARQGKFRRPREVQPETPRSLEAICLKAMSLNPDDRYATPASLASDIEHWLADEPVAAFREPIWQSALRWGRRHRTLAATAAALLVTATAALGIGLVVVKQEQLRTEGQRQTAVAARQMADRNAAEARVAQELAEAEARRADRQSALALSALKTMVFDLQIKLKDVPAAHRVRRDLLHTAIDRLRQVAGNLETDAEANHSLVWAHLDLGDIFLKAGSVDEGDWTRQALELYERGNAIAAQLAEQRQDPQTLHDLALSLDKLGDVRLALGDAGAAETFYRRGLVINQQRKAASPGDVAAAQDLAVSHNNLGDVKLRLGDVSAARAEYAVSLEIARQLAQAEPGNPEARRNLSVSYDRLGAVNVELGSLPAARDAYLQSLEINRQRALGEPDNIKVRIDLAVAHHHVGDVNLQLDRGEQALESFRESLAICESLIAADPDNTEARRMLSVSHQRMGNALMQQGELELAKSHFEKCQQRNQATAEADPANTVAQRDLAVAHEKLGDVNLALRDAAAALAHYQQMFALAEKLAAADPADTQAQGDLAIAHSKMGDAYADQDQLESARQSHQAALQISQQLAAADPANLQTQADLAAARGRLGFLESRDFAFQAAAEHFAAGVALLESLENQNKLEDYPLFQEWLSEQREMARFCREADRVLADVAVAAEASPGEAGSLLSLRLAAMLRRGDAMEVARTAQALGELAERPPAEGSLAPVTLLLQAVQGSAAAAALLRGDHLLAELPEAGAKQHQAMVDQVVHWLSIAKDRGALSDAAVRVGLRQDPALQSLLELPAVAAFFPEK